MLERPCTFVILGVLEMSLLFPPLQEVHEFPEVKLAQLQDTTTTSRMTSLLMTHLTSCLLLSF